MSPCSHLKAVRPPRYVWPVKTARVPREQLCHVNSMVAEVFVFAGVQLFDYMSEHFSDRDLHVPRKPVFTYLSSATARYCNVRTPEYVSVMLSQIAVQFVCEVPRLGDGVQPLAIGCYFESQTHSRTANVFREAWDKRLIGFFRPINFAAAVRFWNSVRRKKE